MITTASSQLGSHSPKARAGRSRPRGNFVRFPRVTHLALSRATMTMARQELGKLGEMLAVEELERRGYAVLARRYRVRGGEIDIVADDDGTLVFVEVKARMDAEFGTAAEAVAPWKRRRLVRMAKAYLSREHVAPCACRFDVVAIMLDGPAPAIEVYTNAFDAG